MAAWFPFRSSRTALSPTGLSPALALSLSYANLAVLLAPQPVKLEWPKSTPATRRDAGWRGRVKVVEQAWETMRAQASKAKGKGKAGGADVWALGEVADWVVDTLVSDPQMVVLSGADKQSSSKDVLAPAMTPAVYAAMLPVIFALLSQPPSPNRGQAGDEDDISTSVWMAFLSHQAKEASTSHLRALADEFLISVLAIHEQRHPSLPFFVPVGSPVRAQIKTWVENVPKSLWELGNRDEAATERLLLFLLDLGLRGSKQAESPVALFPADVSRLPSSKRSFADLVGICRARCSPGALLPPLAPKQGLDPRAMDQAVVAARRAARRQRRKDVDGVGRRGKVGLCHAPGRRYLDV